MDRNRATHIETVVDDLHEKTNGIHIAILQENFETAKNILTEMEESLKHLKENLKVDEI